MPDVPMIKMEACKDGYFYYIEARNARFGIYSQKELGFIISRVKGLNYLFTEYHWDIGTVQPEMAHYGTAKPMKELGPVPEMTDEDKLTYLNQQAEFFRKDREIYRCTEPDPVYVTGPSFDWKKRLRKITIPEDPVEEKKMPM